MASNGITHLIVNSPYAEPKHHWLYHRETLTFSLETGRRAAGYVIASESSKAFDDPGKPVLIELVNKIRPRVNQRRADRYPGVSGITRRLLEHWRGLERYERQRLFFCQFEAMESLIWLTEAPASERVGIVIPSDGGAFQRLCCKMATGSGKTVVMAMLVAWQVLNKVAYPQDHRFSKHIFCCSGIAGAPRRVGGASQFIAGLPDSLAKLLKLPTKAGFSAAKCREKPKGCNKLRCARVSGDVVF